MEEVNSTKLLYISDNECRPSGIFRLTIELTLRLGEVHKYYPSFHPSLRWRYRSCTFFGSSCQFLSRFHAWYQTLGYRRIPRIHLHILLQISQSMSIATSQSKTDRRRGPCCWGWPAPCSPCPWAGTPPAATTSGWGTRCCWWWWSPRWRRSCKRNQFNR